MRLAAFVPLLLARTGRRYLSSCHYKPIGGQEDYVRILNDNDVDLVVCNGPAGTGKTLFACQMALETLGAGRRKNIVITRPTVSTEKDLGALPGDIDSKLSPWVRPIVDAMEEFKSKSAIGNLMNSGTLEIAPLAFMRGRTFKNAIVIADEMQNSTPDQMKMLLTRLGADSKLIITGDVEQCDHKGPNGLADLISRLGNHFDNDADAMGSSGICVVSLEASDIQRSALVKTIVEVYK